MPGSMFMMVAERVGKRVAIDQAQGRVSDRAGEVGAQIKILIVPVYSLQGLRQVEGSRRLFMQLRSRG